MNSQTPEEYIYEHRLSPRPLTFHSQNIVRDVSGRLHARTFSEDVARGSKRVD